MQVSTTPTAPETSHLDDARRLQKELISKLDSSGHPDVVVTAILFNILVHVVDRQRPMGVTRGKYINALTTEFRQRLQRFLP